MAKPTKQPARKVARPRDTVAARPRSPLERMSAPVLLRLHGMPRWIVPFVTAVLLVGGLLTSNAILAAVLVGLLLLLLLWLVALSWPLLSVFARLLRGAVIVGLVMVIIGRIQGRM